MNGSVEATRDFIHLSKRGRLKAVMSQSQRRSSLWTLTGGVVGSTIVLWVMVQLGQAFSESRGKRLSPPARPAAVQTVSPANAPMPDHEDDSRLFAPPARAAQGPALDVPREVIEMLDLRKRDLDRREEAVRRDEERLMAMRAEVEKLLTKNEALEKRIQSARAKDDEGPETARAKGLSEKERLAQEQRTQLAKMYEAMPVEDAAVRLERMPDRKAIEILRLVKWKTAGAILAQVKPDRAAKLTEQLLPQTQ
jgi:flagellar motility protein MotE (MotC chaperone)